MSSKLGTFGKNSFTFIKYLGMLIFAYVIAILVDTYLNWDYIIANYALSDYFTWDTFLLLIEGLFLIIVAYSQVRKHQSDVWFEVIFVGFCFWLLMVANIVWAII